MWTACLSAWRGESGLDSLLLLDPLSQLLIKEHRTRAQYLGLCDTIRLFVVEIDAICQLLPFLTTFDTADSPTGPTV